MALRFSRVCLATLAKAALRLELFAKKKLCGEIAHYPLQTSCVTIVKRLCYVCGNSVPLWCNGCVTAVRRLVALQYQDVLLVHFFVVLFGDCGIWTKTNAAIWELSSDARLHDSFSWLSFAETGRFACAHTWLENVQLAITPKKRSTTLIYARVSARESLFFCKFAAKFLQSLPNLLPKHQILRKLPPTT